MRVQKLKSHQVHFSQNHNERNHENYSNPDIDLEKIKRQLSLNGIKKLFNRYRTYHSKNYKGSKIFVKMLSKMLRLFLHQIKIFLIN